MFTKYDPKILDVVADAKQKKSLKRKRRLINFWRRLTPEQLNLIHRQVQVWPLTQEMHTETCLALGWLLLHGKFKTYLI